MISKDEFEQMQRRYNAAVQLFLDLFDYKQETVSERVLSLYESRMPMRFPTQIAVAETLYAPDADVSCLQAIAMAFTYMERFVDALEYVVDTSYTSGEWQLDTLDTWRTICRI